MKITAKLTCVRAVGGMLLTMGAFANTARMYHAIDDGLGINPHAFDRRSGLRRSIPGPARHGAGLIVSANSMQNTALATGRCFLRNSRRND